MAPIKSQNSNMLLAFLTLLGVIAIVAVVGFFMLRKGPEIIQGQAEVTEYRVSSKVPGRILEFRVKEGQSVNAGDTLAILEAPDVVAKMEQARAAEAAAQAQNAKAIKGAREEHAQPLGRAHVDRGDDAVDLVGGEDVGQRASEFWRVDELGGRTFDLVVYQQEVEETADAAQAAGLRGFFAPAVEEPCHIALDHRSLDLAGGDVVLEEDEVRELAQVAHVRFQGILRETFFEFDIGPVTTSRLFPLFRIFCHPLPAIFRDYR